MKELDFATRAVHGGFPRAQGLESITTPIACTSTFRFEKLDDAIAQVEGRVERAEYSRYENPTVRTAEERIAALEGAQDCVLFSSGMAAVTTALFTMLEAGQHVVMSSDCYRPTEQFIRGTLAKFGVEHTMVAPDDYDGFDAAIIPGKTRVIFTESPTNPYQNVADLDRLVAIKKKHRGVKLLVDATFATPYNQRAFTQGADLVMQSATKYLGGHNDILAGAVSGKRGLISMIRDLRGQLGPACDPHAAFLLLRGLKSFPARMRQHNESALAIARFLESHPQVERVYYPGLESHPHHTIAKSQMSGFGGVVTFTHKGNFSATHSFCDAVRVFQIGASLGGAESMLHPPAVFSYWDLPVDERNRLGMHDNLIRLAIGLESPEDLIADLDQALRVALPGS